jgi:hypothetical protein
MNDHIDQLNETFAAHEHLAPDAEDVLARAHRIARSYHRRRWAVRATGGAVLGAGLIAGSVALPGRLGPSNSNESLASVGVGDGGSPSPSPTTYTQAQEFDAYFAAGYDYQNAQALATIWNDSDITQVKADAGLKLLEGQTLPVTADNPPLSQSQPDITDVDAFFSAGYEYQDAVTLAGMWHVGSYSAKIKGGKLLLAGQDLPIPPSGPPTAAGTAIVGSNSTGKLALKRLTKAQRAKLAKAGKIVVVPGAGSAASSGSGSEATAAAMAAYFAAGYDYQDAVALGKVWNETDINQIKAEAGQKLIAGDTLPVAPSGTPETPTDAAVSAFFAAGYTYQDAVTLGNMWNDSNTYQVKIDAGNKLLDGQTLPIGP